MIGYQEVLEKVAELPEGDVLGMVPIETVEGPGLAYVVVSVTWHGEKVTRARLGGRPQNRVMACVGLVACARAHTHAKAVGDQV